MNYKDDILIPFMFIIYQREIIEKFLFSSFILFLHSKWNYGGDEK